MYVRGVYVHFDLQKWIVHKFNRIAINEPF